MLLYSKGTQQEYFFKLFFRIFISNYTAFCLFSPVQVYPVVYILRVQERLSALHLYLELFIRLFRIYPILFTLFKGANKLRKTLQIFQLKNLTRVDIGIGHIILRQQC